ncbi:MAG: hypothetical protein Q9214_006858, partial [Letrouitia sp. 1 TL-2023]
FFRPTHSRERLKTTREMLTLVLSYHQVMPTFLDFIFPFGMQEHSQGLYAGGFRAECSLEDPPKELQIHQLGRSGRLLELCYNLKAAENSKSRKNWPWSLRQASVYFSFDVETGRMTWILLEASTNLKKKILSSTGSRGLPETKTFETREKSFAAHLAIHTLICQWAAENWQSFFNFLDDKAQDTTRDLLLKDVETQNTATLEERFLPLLSRPSTQNSVKSSILSFNRKSTSGTLWSSKNLTRKQFQAIPESEQSEQTHQFQERSQANSARKKYHKPPSTAGAPSSYSQDEEKQPEEQVTFKNLQEIQYIEEAIHEARLILKQNVHVFTNLTNFYENLVLEPAWPSNITDSCKGASNTFRRRLQFIIDTHQLHLARSEMMLRLLKDRKSLVEYEVKPCNGRAGHHDVRPGQNISSEYGANDNEHE